MFLDTHPISPADLTDLYRSVGWTPYYDNERVMASILPGSTWWSAAFNGDRLVGLVRVISDDVSIAYVQDLLVRPTHQRSGLGSQLLERALDRFGHVRQVVLVTDKDPALTSFYTSVGMTPIESEDGACFVRYGATKDL